MVKFYWKEFALLRVDPSLEGSTLERANSFKRVDPSLEGSTLEQANSFQ